MRRTTENELAALLTASGADLDEIIGGADDRFLMLHDEQCVAAGSQLVHDLDELVGIARMQAHAGFVEDEKRIHQRGAEAGREIDTLGFTAGKCAGGAVEV